MNAIKNLFTMIYMPNLYSKFNIGFFLLFSFILIFSSNLFSQSLNLEQCQSKAKDNYPMIQQFALIEKTTKLTLSNASKAYLPQLTISARATYQSEVIELPISMPGLVIPSLSKDQYQATLDISQVIWDGGQIKSQKRNIQAAAEADKRKLDVDMYALKDRVNQLYFGILLLSEQFVQYQTIENELNTNFKRIQDLKQNGMANQTDLDAISVEQINVNQAKIEILNARTTYMEMLTAFTGIEMNEKTVFEKPEVDISRLSDEVKRPELLLFKSQYDVLEIQKSSIEASNLPKISAFVQGGYGKPGLNMLTNEFQAFYIGGLRFSWNISSLYNSKSNMEKIEMAQKSVDVQKETFLFNNSLQSKQMRNDIDKLKKTLENDQKIVTLRTNIKKANEVKVQNGTATITDLLREINAENTAKQNRIIHEIQLNMTVYQYKNNINN